MRYWRSKNLKYVVIKYIKKKILKHSTVSVLCFSQTAADMLRSSAPTWEQTSRREPSVFLIHTVNKPAIITPPSIPFNTFAICSEYNCRINTLWMKCFTLALSACGLVPLEEGSRGQWRKLQINCTKCLKSKVDEVEQTDSCSINKQSTDDSADAVTPIHCVCSWAYYHDN